MLMEVAVALLLTTKFEKVSRIKLIKDKEISNSTRVVPGEELVGI
jgi:hypothetical protein